MLYSIEGVLAVFVLVSFIAEAGLVTVKFVQMLVLAQAWPSLKALDLILPTHAGPYYDAH